MRLALSILAVAAVATPAFAALAPQYYQQARERAPDVVVFKVESVGGERGPRGYGDCIVKGKVETVDRGTHYRVGGPVTVNVPCRWPGAEMMVGGTIWQTPGSLRASKRGRAWMDSPGQLALSQYEILP